MVPQEAEVVVIGGGVVGSSVAYFLARAGKDVVLVEKGCKAGEASAANASAYTRATEPGSHAGIGVTGAQEVSPKAPVGP